MVAFKMLTYKWIRLLSWVARVRIEEVIDRVWKEKKVLRTVEVSNSQYLSHMCDEISHTTAHHSRKGTE